MKSERGVETVSRISGVFFYMSKYIKNTSEEALFQFDYPVYAKEGQFYLKDILKDEHYDMMVTKNRITVLNKTECGNGGTTGIVDYIKRSKTSCLILVPNVSISMGKEGQYRDDGDVCCVYGGVDKINYDARVVIATYDQFKRLLANLHEFGYSGEMFSNDFWVGRAIFVDEYHKLVDESKFRDVMTSLTELIIKTDSPVALMSATPHYNYIYALREAVGENKQVVTVNVVYNNRLMVKSMGLYEIKQRELEGVFKYFINMDKKVCVFYNNRTKITKALNAIGTDDCEILCSSAKKKECGEYYSSQYNPEKKVHFMTSAYFTGHDIYEEIDHCVIIGSKATSSMALSMRDIKQIIGRFREYCGCGMSNINIMYLKEKEKDIEYNSIKNELLNSEYILNALGDKWSESQYGIKTKLNNMYLNDVMGQLNYWSSDEKLIKELKANEYKVWTKVVDGKRVNKAKSIGELPNYEVEPNLTYKVAYTRIANGGDVSWKEYRDVNKIKDYIDKYGVAKKANGKLVIPTRDSVFDLVKINEVVEKGKTAFENLTVDERYIAFGFDDCAVYKASYLMNCLKYIRVNYPNLLSGELDYGLLPVYMKEVFGCVMFCYKTGTKKNGSADLWYVIGHNIINELKFYTKSYPFSGSNIYIEQLHEKGEDLVYNTIKLSYGTGTKTDNHRYAKTIDWKQLPLYLPSLTGIPLYDWIIKDKANRLDQVKNNESDIKTWREIKNFAQLQISEFYKDTINEYRHIKSEMNEISSLIIDIDDSIHFNKFKEIYKDWAWLAYPTLSNITSNWNKFRVIIPLAHPVKIEGDDNIKVLKALRASFCPYEDKCHNLGSYINLNGWGEKYINKGRVFEVEQSEVYLLQHMIRIATDCSKKKFEKHDIMVSAVSSKASAISDKKWWSMDNAIKYYEKAEALPMEGERHATLFKIKNNLSEEDCIAFERWLMANYPSKMHHWKSHKRITI